MKTSALKPIRYYNVFYIVEKYDDAWLIMINGVMTELDIDEQTQEWILRGRGNGKSYSFDDFLSAIEYIDLTLLYMNEIPDIVN